MKRKFTRILGVGLAIVFLSSVLMAAPLSADIWPPTVIVEDADEDPVISSTSEYRITFVTNDEIPNTVDDWIEIRFPEDTDVADNFTDGDITILATAGFGVAITPAENVTGDNITVTEQPDDVYTVNIPVDELDNAIGEGAQVRVTFTLAGGQITNPDDAGMYTLEVRTSEEDDWVESVAYEIEIPDVATLPGVASVYNDSDILMSTHTGDSAIQDAIDASADDWTIYVGPGEYDQALTIDKEVIIEASGAMADTIIDGDVAITADDVTISGFTFKHTVTVTADDVVIENSKFKEYSSSPTQLVIASGADDVDINNNTFDVTDDTSIGIDVQAGDVEIDGNTFEVESGTIAIIIASATDVEEDNTFTGSSGTGIQVTANVTVLIEGNTFDGLQIAIDANAGTIRIEDNSITNSEDVGIDVAETTGEILIINNILTGNDEALQVADGMADNVTLMFNTLTDNDDHIDQKDTVNDLNAINNWWGADEEPASALFAGDGDVDLEPWLGSAVTGSDISTNDDELDAESEAGVEVTSDAVVDIISAASYASNPGGDTPDPAIAFFDVYVSDPAGAATEIGIRLHADVTANTVAYVWGALQGAWVKVAPTDPDDAATQGVSLFGGYVWITVEDDGTVPTIEDLSGTVFALVEPEVVAEMEATLVSPVFGSEDVSITPTLTWTEVDSAVGYEVAIAEDATFAILDYSASTTLNGLVVTEELKNSTTYYWRVRAVTGPAEPKQAAPGGPWTVGLFTTEGVAVEAAPPIVIEEITTPPPQITLTIPPAEITEVVVEIPAPVQAIPTGLLLTVIGIGAVLVIALIVLIVRTRRVA